MHTRLKRIAMVASSILATLTAPNTSYAHEVYVLHQDTIDQALLLPGFSMREVILANLDQFMLWAFVSILVVTIVFFVSISRSIERFCDGFLAKLPPYAPVISRITVGVSFIAAGYYQALFGPELPLADMFRDSTPLIATILAAIGCMITFGFYARLAALMGLLFFTVAAYVHGLYLLTYATYVGELLLLLLLGAHRLAYHHKGHDFIRTPAWFVRIKTRLAPYAFMILRITFGVSLIYSSLYAKVIHNQLALAVATAYPDISAFFGFTPEFLVLGAAIIELVLGIFFILGIEIRFTSLFVLFWLSLSLWYFGEVVWPHIILIGIPIAFIFYGYDKYSLEGYFFKHGDQQPVL